MACQAGLDLQGPLAHWPTPVDMEDQGVSTGE